MRGRGQAAAVPAADRGSRPDALPARVRRRHLRGSALARPRLGRAGARPVAADRRLCRSARSAARRAGSAYACFCTRADIAQSLTAPHGDAGDVLSRHLPRPARRSRAARDHAALLAARFGARRWTIAGLPSWTEADGSSFDCSAGDIGDAILARKDAPASYHLACVVDDAASGVTLVVRGADLRPSTPIQRLLQTLLGLPEPDLSPPSAGRSRGRPPPRQARPRADARGDARERRRRAGARRRACSTASFPLVSPFADA